MSEKDKALLKQTLEQLRRGLPSFVLLEVAMMRADDPEALGRAIKEALDAEEKTEPPPAPPR